LGRGLIEKEKKKQNCATEVKEIIILLFVLQG
jgi:hypothetical protein